MIPPAGAARRSLLAAAAIPALAVLAYLPAFGGGWIWDDGVNLTECAAVQSWSGLADIWLRPEATQQYYPLTYSVFWLEHKVWGLRPEGFHAVNVALHALNALLLLSAFRRLGLDRAAAWIAAALFAVHPVHAESVAWVTERRNVLSMAFYLGSGILWLRAAGIGEGEPDDPGSRPRRPGAWAGSLALFVLALLSKTATVTLPALLLVLVWWKRGRVAGREVLSLLPHFAAAVAAGLLTMHLERTQIGARGEEFDLGPAVRILIAGRAAWFYAWKTAVPSDLAAVYERWEPDPGAAWQWIFPAAAAAVPVALYLLRHRIGRGPVAAVLAFGGTLFPVLGFFDIYYYLFSWVADHFVYHATPALLAVAGVALSRAGGAAARLRPALRHLPAGAVVATLGVACAAQAAMYRDHIPLWTETVRRSPGAWVAWSNLGSVILDQGRSAEAEPLLRKSVEMAPRNHKGWSNLGVCLADLGRPAEAVEAFERFVALVPGTAAAWENLGRACLYAGDRRRAIEALRRAVSLTNAGPDTYAVLLAAHRMGDGEEAEALEVCRAARDRFPTDERFLFPLIALHLGREETAEALAVAEGAVARTGRRDPRFLDSLAVCLAAAGRFEDAVRTAEEALRRAPPPEVAEALRGHLERFRRGEPAHR